MKMNYRKWLVCGLIAASVCIGVDSLQAQDNGGNPPPAGGNGGNGGQGGQGGGQRRQRGNFDPAQMMQNMMSNVQDQLGFTNDTEWSAVEPLVQKVFEAQRDARGPGMGRLFGRGGNRGGQNGGQTNRPRGGGMFGQTSPEYDALSKALDDNAPAGQIKDLLTKYQASLKTKQAALETAQANLRAVLTSKQEAQATLLGLLN